ncbi:hypothetical protein PtB15_13B538 [Puccinia triticina]|nr:hypothetical protein PtB15_13B538 [Puccinia triticina]
MDPFAPPYVSTLTPCVATLRPGRDTQDGESLRSAEGTWPHAGRAADHPLVRACAGHLELCHVTPLRPSAWAPLGRKPGLEARVAHQRLDFSQRAADLAITLTLQSLGLVALICRPGTTRPSRLGGGSSSPPTPAIQACSQPKCLPPGRPIQMRAIRAAQAAKQAVDGRLWSGRRRAWEGRPPRAVGLHRPHLQALCYQGRGHTSSQQPPPPKTETLGDPARAPQGACKSPERARAGAGRQAPPPPESS